MPVTMEKLVHNINGKDYLFIDVPLNQNTEKVINETFTKFDIIEVSVSILTKNLILKKLLIACSDLDQFRSELCDIENSLKNCNQEYNGYLHRVAFKAFEFCFLFTLILITGIIIHSLLFKS